ncbi:M14 family zinc carboxypeptidase [Nonomuraea sp. NPDC005983]|uniref:M14 family zinc carboxypeptidase n=1 Tax=Nonomuraea sp. NPDC005983 TaxID=3155595 RepID=UPI0033A903A9
MANANKDLVKIQSIGRTLKGQDILAVKVTTLARALPDGVKPATLFSATQHAREWISTEVEMRLLKYVLANRTALKDLLDRTELWFVPVANPDGYDFTFTEGNRLWRKNLRDVNGDGKITIGDGVDPNRNFPTNFHCDEEGSSSIPSSDTYRGAGPASEPETVAMDGLLRRIRFKGQVNYHSYGPLLLYPQGWQIATKTADDPIYDMDKMGRKAPHALGVLSHYKAVVWETGDDIIPRSTGQVPGTTSKGGVDTELAVRDYLNEGGKLLHAGKYPSYAANANGQYYFQPDQPAQRECATPTDPPCIQVFNDFQQYWLGAYVFFDDAGTDQATGRPYELKGVGGRFDGFAGTLAPSHTNSYVATSAILPARQFPRFASSAPVKWARPGGPFDPHTGSWDVYTGSSCAPPSGGAGWRTIHPFTQRYQGPACEPTGTSGAWNAASGNSAGWQQWKIDLTPYAGKQVELSISYVSDWGTQGAGVFLDDFAVTLDGATAEQSSFEADLGGWTVAGPPAGSSVSINNWFRTDQVFEEGGGLATKDTVYLGFGVESLTSQAARTDLVKRSMRHLLG